MNDEQVTFLTCGILFNKSFRVLDSWGSIADEVLYNSGVFSPEFFTNISDTYTLQRYLNNPNKGHILTLNSENLVLTQKLENEFSLEFDQFKKRIEYLIENVVIKYKLVTKRIGVVYVYPLTKEDMNKLFENYLKVDIKGITSFRFSQKDVTQTGLVRADINNFYNKIITVGNIENDKPGITFDYQLIFSPPHEDIRPVAIDFANKSYELFLEELK